MLTTLSIFGAFLLGRFCRWRDRPDRLVVDVFSDDESKRYASLKRQLGKSLLSRSN